MAGPTPIVRQMILCERLVYTHGVGYTLINPRVDFHPSPGETFPLAYPELWLFAQVSGSYGRQTFRLRMVDVTDPTVSPEKVFEIADRAIDLGRATGPHRLRVRNWAIKLTVVAFPKPGRYELWMTFDGVPHAKVEFLVEGAP